MPPLTLPAGVRWRSLHGAERLVSVVLVLQLLVGTLAVLGLSGKPDEVPAAAAPTSVLNARVDVHTRALAVHDLLTLNCQI